MVYSFMGDRRQHRRFVVDGDAIVTIGAARLPGKLVDVGKGGALVMCESNTGIGEEVRLRFAIEGYSLEIEAAGRVVRSEPGLLGIEFPAPPVELDEVVHWLEAMFFAAMV